MRVQRQTAFCVINAVKIEIVGDSVMENQCDAHVA